MPGIVWGDTFVSFGCLSRSITGIYFSLSIDWGTHFTAAKLFSVSISALRSRGTRPITRARGDRLVCHLRSHPPLPRALFTTYRRLLTVFITIVAPTLLVYRTLNLPTRSARRVVDVSLFTSNITSVVRVGT